MALDTLALGPFLFQDFAVPDRLPGGGKHQVSNQKMPGGDRDLNTMGPDDNDRVFTVQHVGSQAQAEVQTLDQMRISGQVWPCSNGMEARMVVISEFTWEVVRFNVINSTITLTPTDNPVQNRAASTSLDSLIQADLQYSANLIQGLSGLQS